ncbi:hypothetical protein [Streptomyces sp. NPDC058279]|uniref:hypothetical protein n=1 Tax=Streptomyces sp. NPDC058279 TaxID=3346418 RepID=UPI0036E57AB5
MNWSVGPAQALESLPLDQQFAKLRENLGALAAVAANPSSALGRFLGGSVAALAPVVRRHPADSHNTAGIVPDRDQITDAALGFRRLRNLLLTVQG